MEYVADIATEWANFAQPAILGAATLHLPTPYVQVGLDTLLGLGRHGAWAFYIVSEEDKPTNRHLTFWKRHTERLRPPARTWEEQRAGEGRLTRAALMELPSSDDVCWAMQSREMPSQHVYFVPFDVTEPRSLLRDILATADLRSREFHSRGFVPTLLRQGLAHDFVVVRPEDDLEGHPGVGIYGSQHRVAVVREAIDAATR